MKFGSNLTSAALIVMFGAYTLPAVASDDCDALPSHGQLGAELAAVVAAGGNGGLGNDMWATLVDRDGIVCAIAFTGADRGDQWPGSRVISAQKANTANAFSLEGAYPNVGSIGRALSDRKSVV